MLSFLLTVSVTRYGTGLSRLVNSKKRRISVGRRGDLAQEGPVRVPEFLGLGPGPVCTGSATVPLYWLRWLPGLPVYSLCAYIPPQCLVI